MAGPGGFEPPNPALEAGGLPLAYGPITSFYLNLAVERVFAAPLAKLLKLQCFLRVYFALFSCVVKTLAFAALEA